MAILKSRAIGRKILRQVRTSYWFWPSTLVLGALCLAALVEWIDTQPGLMRDVLPDWLTAIDPDGARDTLSTLATAVIGVAGVMFSMTLVAVSFAADTFGPRLIGNFMRDRGTQISFGLLLGTFVFNIVMLRSVQGGDAAFVPYAGLTMALFLALISVFTIIYYIHHVPETINVSNISSDLGHQFSASIRELIAERAKIEVEDVRPALNAQEIGVTLAARGYIQQLDTDALHNCACDNDWIIQVERSAGEFITPHTDVLTVLTVSPLTDKQIKVLQSAFATGNDRTEVQSTAYFADQLVEMIARALSPGFNDPFTAMNCLNWLDAGLQDALLHDGGLKPLTTQRVRYPHLDFPALFAVSFGAALPYTVTDRMCRARHLALTQELLTRATGRNRDVIAALVPALRAGPRERAL
ncbi:DUF2254 domain-containing protein [Loktanella salsilacus]|uniref:DUF2254 domain-containing protein n=1 Tax=Loktanella salsilacus TaxID=195913 RepID=UPI00356ADBE2